MAEETLYRYVTIPPPRQLYVRSNGVKVYDDHAQDFEWFVLERLLLNPKWVQGGPVRVRLQRDVEDSFDRARADGRVWKLDGSREGVCSRCAEAANEAGRDNPPPATVVFYGGRAYCGLHGQQERKAGRSPDIEHFSRGPLTPFLKWKDGAHALVKECVEKPVHEYHALSPLGMLEKKTAEGYGLQSAVLTQLIDFEQAILDAPTTPPPDSEGSTGA